MQRLKFVVVVVVALACLPSLAEAQGKEKNFKPGMCGEGVAITPECQREYEHWVELEMKWRRHMEQWGNQTYNQMYDYAIKIMPRPTPPWWMRAHCQEFIDSRTVTEGTMCAAYVGYLDYDWVEHYVGPEGKVTYTRVLIQSTSGGEGSSLKEFLLKNFHFDGIWTNSSNAPRSYGFLGAHVTLAHAGRVYFWGPIGFLFVKQPIGPLKVMGTFGIDIYLFEPAIPFFGKRPLYLTLGKVFNKQEAVRLFKDLNAGTDMIGLSFTWKR